jgi:hypothetical protein
LAFELCHSFVIRHSSFVISCVIWSGPAVPPRWDDSQRYPHAYGDSDTHSNATAYFDAQAASHAGAETVILEMRDQPGSLKL